MPQDPSASRMMSTLQSSGTPVSQQFISPNQTQDPEVDHSTIQATDPVSVPAVQAVPQPVEPAVESQPADMVSEQCKLAIFENVLEQASAQSQEPQTQQQPQQQPTGSASKEQLSSGQVASQELPGGMQYADAEPVPEIPLEVENYLQHVEENHQQMPEQIVQAAKEFQAEATPDIPTQSVKVLPITKEVAEEGKKKSTKFAVRWLVEFSNKISHLFAGKSIYRAD